MQHTTNKILKKRNHRAAAESAKAALQQQAAEDREYDSEGVPRSSRPSGSKKQRREERLQQLPAHTRPAWKPHMKDLGAVSDKVFAILDAYSRAKVTPAFVFLKFRCCGATTGTMPQLVIGGDSGAR